MGGMLHQENLLRGRVAMVGCNWICNVVVFNENPASTTLVNFVGSVLSHSLNKAYLASPKFPFGDFRYARNVI